MSQWTEFYRGRMGQGYQDYATKRYMPFIQRLVQEAECVETHIKRGVTFREEGAGIGTITAILQRYALNHLHDWGFLMIDKDKGMAALATENTGIVCQVGDILTRKPDNSFHWVCGTDIIHSHGVLEHFEDEEIKSIINDQRHMSQHCVVAYVPTNGYKEPSFGDERLLPYEHWVKTFHPDTWELFNGGKDLLLTWNSYSRSYKW